MRHIIGSMQFDFLLIHILQGVIGDIDIPVNQLNHSLRIGAVPVYYNISFIQKLHLIECLFYGNRRQFTGHKIRFFTQVLHHINSL